MSKCPCCGSQVDETAIVWDAGSSTLSGRGMSVHLGPKRALMFDIMWRRKAINSDDLVSAVYADDVNGGPENARSSVSVMMMHLRRQIAPFGITIESSNGRGAHYVIKFSNIAAPEYRRGSRIVADILHGDG